MCLGSSYLALVYTVNSHQIMHCFWSDHIHCIFLRDLSFLLSYLVSTELTCSISMPLIKFEVEMEVGGCVETVLDKATMLLHRRSLHCGGKLFIQTTDGLRPATWDQAVAPGDVIMVKTSEAEIRGLEEDSEVRWLRRQNQKFVPEKKQKSEEVPEKKQKSEEEPEKKQKSEEVLWEDTPSESWQKS